MLEADGRSRVSQARPAGPGARPQSASTPDGAARLERILNASNDGYWEWELQSDTAWVSPRYSEIVGLPAPDGFLPVAALRAAIHPDDLASLVEKTSRVIASPIHGDSYQIEHRWLRPDGQEVWVDARATVTARAPDGRATQISGAITDITTRKHSEDVLRRFELISENTRDIILFLRRDDGRILGVNAAAVVAYGYTEDELLRMTIRDLRAPTTLPLVPEEMQRADVETILFETVHRRKDGSTFPAEVSSRGSTIGGVRTLISIIR